MKVSWRRREDVSRMRFILILLAAPMLISIGRHLIFSEDVFRDILSFDGVWVVWSLTVGLVFDLCVARYRNKIGRWDCLAIGLVAGATQPSLIVILHALLPADVFFALGLTHFDVAIAELPRLLVSWNGLIAAAPMGAYGLIAGGILWLIGVRTAPAPEPIELSEVFR